MIKFFKQNNMASFLPLLPYLFNFIQYSESAKHLEGTGVSGERLYSIKTTMNGIKKIRD